MKILLVCSGGMSTSLLVDAAKKTAEKENFQCDIQAGAVSLVDEKAYLFDIILVAPQVRHRLTAIKESAAKHNKLVAVIPQEIYGQLQGDALIALAKKLLNPQNNAISS